MRLIFCFSRSCFEYSDDLRRRAVAWPCWPGAYGRRSTGHFSVKHFVALRNSLVPSRRHCRQLAPVYRPMAQTLRRFGGRQPLCGIGVTSLIALTSCPAAASAAVRALTGDGQVTAVAHPTVRADVHQSLDVHRDFGPQRALDPELLLDHLAELVHVRVREIPDPQRRVDASLLDDLLRRRPADAVDVRQTDLDLLVAAEIDSRNT